jgi:hypothetical protein
MTLHMGGSDAQMPAYMLSLWVWARAFDQSEFAFRAINLIWLAVVMVLPFRHLQAVAAGLPAVALSSSPISGSSALT